VQWPLLQTLVQQSVVKLHWAPVLPQQVWPGPSQLKSSSAQQPVVAVGPQPEPAVPQAKHMCVVRVSHSLPKQQSLCAVQAAPAFPQPQMPLLQVPEQQSDFVWQPPNCAEQTHTLLVQPPLQQSLLS
jgi:hypothetical protein